MKRALTLTLFVLLFGCKQTVEKADSVENTDAKTEKEEVESQYPEDFAKVLDAHGTLNQWRSKRTLSFELVKPNASEVHTVDLNSRRDRIDMGDVSMGFDGTDIWLKDDQGAYTGNPAVYHNLMFYFFAMPFVFADPGINYGETPPLTYGGKEYPGIHISYDNGVGASSKDDYYLHYDPETFQMAWLGYTFTYGSDEKSENVKWIRYDDWDGIGGVLLPRSITWYDYEGRTIKEAKKQTSFVTISLDVSPKPDTFYQKPENAKVVLKP
ncbi:DUF6503 family protein [Pseudozobellia thermophila]|uniref:Threonine synthase n=1 Tax=Pseudozobellia thermophila TaxID=192903 RepID=A0A1M6J335_9FLAO|nr:DUF6503 family protein [Pseudozobellia thermophila]SHJ41135.1 hypothetical protein SAMN04488513_104225 [Pseudozobellia thermophila]